LSVIQPFGEVVLLSVSETAVPIYTRTVLAKGIRFIGCSRSKREDFTHVIELLSAHPELRTYLSALVNDVRTVRSVADMAQAFEADAHNPMGKTIMQWNV
jgi:ribitol-5-phosphate 2-dehydrogenase